MILQKGVLKICSEFTGENPCQSVISIKLLCNFIEITLRHRCSPVNLLRIFRTPFPKNTSEGLLLAHLPSPLFLSIRHGRVDRLERNNDTLHSLILQYTGLKGNTIIKSMNHNNKHISPIDLKTQVRYTSRKLGAKFQINDPVNMIQYVTANVQNHLPVRTA